ncbi:hypothetical protein SAMN05660337_3249 [Maridesulfovibrio ferrireducens]|uniref:Uncharacterized protein n=1 Tax=Maridesulfovibrio ferrireducens TaxID=246191 RepID=A0A1G9KY51_9BACT|nr:hypothetical protein [Maridesulfovibrio ferrireducens]SDL54397.1 hypothetical protein SAMN05660337_3249 [Maridesulfovibrio ferrireducens]
MRKKYDARVEVIASLSVIRELTKKGYSKKAIYKKLKNDELLTISYVHFCRFDLDGNLPRQPKKSTFNFQNNEGKKLELKSANPIISSFI